MKRILLSLGLLATITLSASAQMLQLNGYKNTLWTGFGNAWDYEPGDRETSKAMLDSQNWAAWLNDDDIRWNGFTDTFQANFTSKKLSIDLMLQWSALSTYDGDEDLDYLRFRYMDSDVNFIYNATENFDLAMGTYLNWNMGPAPMHGANSWEIAYHLKQGGLNLGNPGSSIIAGGTFYANKINESARLAESTNVATEALALRYSIEDILTLAAAIPSESTTDEFIANVGVTFTPAEQILIAATYNGLFRKDSNAYVGATIGLDTASIDLWFGLNNIGGKKDNRITGFGGAVNFSTGEITLRPELGFTFYENDDYSTAGYLGVDLTYAASKELQLGIWGSYAIGSESDDYNNDDAGKVFDLRPSLSYFINSTDVLGLSFEYEAITTWYDKDYDFWQFGFFWTHAF